MTSSKDKRGNVYFGQRDTGLVKIGFTTWNVPVRLHELQWRGIGKVIELASCRGGWRMERRFHAFLEPDHVGGEWFEPTDRVLETAAAVKDGSFDFDELPAGWCITKPFQTKPSLAHWGPLPRFADRQAA